MVCLQRRKARVSCVDFSRPMVLVCDDLGLTGSETKLELDADTPDGSRRGRRGELDRKRDFLSYRADVATNLTQGGRHEDGHGQRRGDDVAKDRVRESCAAAPTSTRGTHRSSQRICTTPSMTACQCLGAASLIDGTVASEIASGLPTDSLTPADGDHEVIVSHPSGSSQAVPRKRRARRRFVCPHGPKIAEALRSTLWSERSA